MSVLSLNFDFDCNQCSPVQIDYLPKKDIDEFGNEFLSYEKVDYPSIVKAHGSCELWSLGALNRSGVDPRFSIHTGFNTGLELDSVVNAAASVIDSVNVETSN